MSALRKMTNFLGYSEPVDGDYADVPEDSRADFTQDLADDYADREVGDNVYEAPFEEAPAPAETPDLRRIVTVHPSTYNEARVIGESFRDGVPVIVNLTNMSESDARRMVDFAAGLVFGLHGAIERVTPRVFLLTPTSVAIDDGEGAEDAHGRFFNQS
ncbi:MAG: cell division protein SepF [Actinomyces ruminicola]|uniref:Cell division protein SepF n=1 Tax=Actinomyces ruminicola TaxID=332524 RepID=A0A1G9TNF2_9ACTO|nr:cell division protein SepF [Actinomyces ruminicola]MBE6481002.1 cell division protein SepF [Actinomyces ruminicola]SDM49181.1 cell division inhibitor SepF [Actinomyces ruminicola]